MRWTDDDRLDVDMFSGDRDVDIRARKVKIVTTRKPHLCCTHDGYKGGEIPAGTRALRETAVVDGEWGTNYVCCACIDAWLDEIRSTDSV